jgi:valyl-tRNA synthetase
MSKSYNPKKVEGKIYHTWEKSNYFKTKIDPKKKPFVVDMPLPNITGDLHIGHALNHTIQDILTRWHRMQGIPSLWVPGTDHAGIGMQVVVEKDLYKKTGKNRKGVGRKKFEKLLWAWKEKYGEKIIEEIKLLGASCDWSRQRFTLDKEYQHSVAYAFIEYFKKGYIYHGSRLINWCPRCQTVVSDLEVEYRDVKSYLWYIKYPIKQETRNPGLAKRPVLDRVETRSGSGAGKKQTYIVVTTTRPETMLGDTAVAVNPKDKKYKNFFENLDSHSVRNKKIIGKTIILPIVNREIPIIADQMVDIKFGTGAVKVTPAHDFLDYELGQKHNLEEISVIGPDNKMNSEAGEFEGLPYSSARGAVADKLAGLGLLEKKENYIHSVGMCGRCGEIIEPLLSKQWFLSMKKIAAPAIKAVEGGKIKFIPSRWNRIYLSWMKNINDWCISRQLWWGHRIPIWYCETCDEVIASIKKPQCPSCKSSRTTQDPDVLDTWFSSALWPFATLGWPQKTRDLSYFYPTSVLVTGKDIIYLWVARMIFSGIEFMKNIPFSDVFINATVLDSKGKKMSKSKGNVIDPVKLIENYGADATRFGLIYQTSWGQDMTFQESRILTGKKFCNKIWNASRFVMMNLKDIKTEKAFSRTYKKSLTTADKKILSKIQKTAKEVNQALKIYRFGQAIESIYDFFWHDFCDQYIETAKKQMQDEKKKIFTQSVLFEALESSLKLLHPFIPFITEEIWQDLKKNNLKLLKKYYNYKKQKMPKSLIIASWIKG